MKKLHSILVVLFVFASTTLTYAQGGEAESGNFTHNLLNKFIDGDPTFMGTVLIALILGLAFSIERIISLTLAGGNTDKLMNDINGKLKGGDIDGAKALCMKSTTPMASIAFQGLNRSGESVDVIEKTVVAYGSVEMGKLEKGLSWIGLMIALAPMLGFMGTVIGMIQAFEDIQRMGDLKIDVVAGGIKVALLTTVFGLIAAIILQIFYNYIVARIDSLVNDMEEKSITLVDMMLEHKLTSDSSK
ncbi:MAG: MotA/TolQ/ExbB proton channel family protein [Chitinophagales bacterium]